MLQILSYVGWHCAAAIVVVFVYVAYFHYLHRSGPPYSGLVAAAVLFVLLPALFALPLTAAFRSGVATIVAAAVGALFLGAAVFLGVRYRTRRTQHSLYYGPPMRCFVARDQPEPPEHI